MTSSINEKIVEQIKAKKAEMKELESVANNEIKRARDEKGHYVADDPDTPDINEAWEGGKAPKKKAKTTAKKKTVKKKTVSKKKTTKKKE
jgi:hypothetical protein